jgi:Domain of unknown function (DUF4432)
MRGGRLVVTLWGRRWSRDELLARVGRLEQLAGVRLVEGGDGAERGVRLLRCSTGAGFEFEILVDRGFDVGGAWLGGQPLHGRYTGLPARLAGYGARWDGDDCVLWAEGEVVQAALFGEQLMLRRRIEADLGGISLRITDTVVNIGPTPCPHMMLYHCNVGFPVVDAGAELVYPAGPGTCVSSARTIDYRELTGPQAGFVEECYEHDMRAGADAMVGAAVVNRAAGLGVFQRYDPATLPRHITWRQLGTVAYVVAMEPSTNRDAGRFDARERGELAYLAPGEERRYRLEIGALDGRDAIETFAAGARAAGAIEQAAPASAARASAAPASAAPA